MDASRSTALLGPTNTGKTHRAIERMLDHATGMIGLPLRLLAREVYDRVTARVGEARVALITGEEKRVPKRPDYWVCTVEAMPLDREVDFIAVDEVQLAAHDQRGHVFTDRLLHARGRRETCFMGSDTARSVVEALVPAATIESHPRLSRLSWVEPTTLARVPPRSAVVAFSMTQVYEVAEKLRALRGGTAVVLGALSPRTRNAQVAMFQAGEVDFLVATDAIGMGLNLDLRHVAFASLRKFDGRDVRELDPSELGQIAGRAGRWIDDGTFTTVSPLVMDLGVRAMIEQHRFAPLRKVFWRAHEPDATTVESLMESLRAPPPRPMLRRVGEAEDEQCLAALSTRKEVRTRATSPERVALLWAVCQVPDFRKLLFEAHVDQLEGLYVALCDHGRLRDSDLATEVGLLDDTEGDVETLVGRLASVRTWTYVANHPAWVEHAHEWQERTRALEDRLSDALHERLVMRFVDVPGAPRPRSSPRPRRVTPPTRELVVDPRHPFAQLRAMRDALSPKTDHIPLPAERQWVESLIEAPASRFTLSDDGVIRDGERDVAKLTAGSSLAQPGARLVGFDDLGGGARSRLERRLVAHARDIAGELLAPLRAVEEPSAATRGLLYRLEHGLGSAWRSECEDSIAALSGEDRAALEATGVVFGARVVFSRRLLRPEAVARRAVLVALRHGAKARAPSPGAVSFDPAAGVAHEAWMAMGYPVVAGKALRCDVIERVCAAEGEVDAKVAATWMGLSVKEAARVIGALRG